MQFRFLHEYNRSSFEEKLREALEGGWEVLGISTFRSVKGWTGCEHTAWVVKW